MSVRLSSRHRFPRFARHGAWAGLLALVVGVGALPTAQAVPRAPTPGTAESKALLAAAADAPPTLPWTLIATQPHDARVFTEGLAVGPDGLLYESAGLYEASGVLKTDPASGQAVATRPLAGKYFGEGLAYLGGSFYQLTWREKTLLRWTAALEPAQAMPFPWEGWGLTAYKGQLVASDGSETLRFFTPTGMGPAGLREVNVTEGEGRLPLDQLNELEAIPAGGPAPLAGKILANVWHTPRVAVIDPASGRVTAWIDLTDLVRTLPAATLKNPEAVANGLAWDPKTNLLHVTGKLWPSRFVLRVGGAPAAGPARPH